MLCHAIVVFALWRDADEGEVSFTCLLHAAACAAEQALPELIFGHGQLPQGQGRGPRALQYHLMSTPNNADSRP